MDQERSGEVLDRVDERIDKKLGHSVEGVAIDVVDEGSLGETRQRASVSGEDGALENMERDLGLNGELQEGPDVCMDQDMCDHQKVTDTLHGDDQGTSYNSRNLVNGGVIEAVIVIESAETESLSGDNRKLEAKVDESRLSKVSMKAPKGAVETDKNSSGKIDIKCSSNSGFSENLEGERICRICHLASGRPSDATAVSGPSSASCADLIQLGCACKDELGIVHSHCAEAWFKLKGNRFCEICGETAKNVYGVADNGFIEEWNEMRFTDSGSTSSGMFRGCWRGQPFCNFLMACLVIAFVLPWFFRVNMF